MKTHVMPAQFDGEKFGARYSLSTRDGSFFVGGDGLLHYPDSLPDEPIFDPPDPPAVRQTKFTAGASNRNPTGFVEARRGQFIPYFD